MTKPSRNLSNGRQVSGIFAAAHRLDDIKRADGNPSQRGFRPAGDDDIERNHRECSGAPHRPRLCRWRSYLELVVPTPRKPKINRDVGVG